MKVFYRSRKLVKMDLSDYASSVLVESSEQLTEKSFQGIYPVRMKGYRTSIMVSDGLAFMSIFQNQSIR